MPDEGGNVLVVACPWPGTRTVRYLSCGRRVRPLICNAAQCLLRPMTHEKEFSRQQLPQNSHRRDSRGTKVVAIFDLQRQNKFAMREYFQAPVAQRMAVPPFRDLLPVAEQAARGISDIPSCTTGTRRSPHGVSAGGGGGHLSYRSSSFVSTDGKAIEDMQAALDLRNKLSCWGVTDGKGRPQGVSVSTKPNPSSSHSAVPSLEALGLTADKSELLGESVIFDFEVRFHMPLCPLETPSFTLTLPCRLARVLCVHKMQQHRKFHHQCYFASWCDFEYAYNTPATILILFVTLSRLLVLLVIRRLPACASRDSR